jgi:5-methylthioadenosine/S-adenosylhomocysteine deaminase
MAGFIRARFLLPMSDQAGRDLRIEDGYVLWSEETITEVGPYDDKIGERLLSEHPHQLLVHYPGEGIQIAQGLCDLKCYQGVILPGFIKAHGHDLETSLIGLVKDVPLTLWLDGVINPFNNFLMNHTERLTKQLGATPHRVSYLKARLDDLHYGITTSMVHHCNYAKYFVDELVDVNEEIGTHMIVAVGSQDRNYYEKVLDLPMQTAIDRLDDYHSKHKDCPLTTIIPGPDQLFSNGPELLKASKQWARDHGTLFHCHSSEELKTTQWFVETYGMTPVQYADSLGILDDNTVLAHQVQSTKEDLDILERTGTRIVHNPLANTILGSGMPPLLDMLDRGILVSVSTDGSASSDNQNILAAARLASQYQKAFHKDASKLPAQRVLELITVDAANVLKVNAGSLDVGRLADLTVISTTRTNLVPTRISNVVENLVWASDGSEVSMVIAGGNLLRDENVFTTLDRDEIIEKVSVLSQEFDTFVATTNLDVKGTGAHR